MMKKSLLLFSFIYFCESVQLDLISLYFPLQLLASLVIVVLWVDRRHLDISLMTFRRSATLSILFCTGAGAGAGVGVGAGAGAGAGDVNCGAEGGGLGAESSRLRSKP